MIPLAKVFNRSTYNLTTNGDGTLLVVLNPWGSFTWSPAFTAATEWFPWMVINQSAGNLVYQGSTPYAGPFLSQANNV